MKKLFTKFRHYIEYIILICFIKAFRIIGIDRASNLSAIIARNIGPLLPVTKMAKRNINNALGIDVGSSKFIKELWDNFGRFIGEFPFIDSLSENEISERIQISGLEHVEKLKQLNQPFLLFTGHFANWDIILRVINKFYHRFGVVYRKANNPYVNNVINDLRQANNVRLIAKGPKGAKDLLRSFKQKEAIALLVDQRMNEGMEIPFFDRSAMTANAIAKFALQFNYPIIPCQIIRIKGSYFKVIISEPLKYEITNDSKNNYYNIMLNINQILEKWIREYPTQWLWFHNRWGEKN